MSTRRDFLTVTAGAFAGWLTVYAGGDLWLGPTFAIVGTGGYRYARTNSVTIAGGTLITSNGEADKADYSGVFFRVGIKLAAPEN